MNDIQETAPAPGMRVAGLQMRAAGRMPSGHSPMVLRLALAFVTVALIPLVLVALLAVLSAANDVSALVDQRHGVVTRTLLQGAVETYQEEHNRWDPADLRPMLMLASHSGAVVIVLDAAGRFVASTGGQNRRADPGITAHPLLLDGQRIGTLLVRFGNAGFAASAGNVRSSLVRVVTSGAGLAAVLALLASLLVSRLITRPVLRLIEMARRRGRGDRQARVGEVRGAPAELRELAAAFDQMADNISAQEQLHRDLIADVAHELRTPVAVLQANTEALLDGLVEHTPEQTASLHEEVLRLGRMVDDLQQLAAAEAAALHMTLRPCDLGDIAAEAAAQWDVSFAGAQISFEVDLAYAPVRGDRGRLHQVTGNLLSNALKHTPPGGSVRLAVSACPGADGTSYARLEVNDNGPGISPEEQRHVFERLWRGAHGAGTAGSGIGLAIAAEMARAHHGSIEVASERGHGARFTLMLPLAPGTPESPDGQHGP